MACIGASTLRALLLSRNRWGKETHFADLFGFSVQRLVAAQSAVSVELRDCASSSAHDSSVNKKSSQATEAPDSVVAPSTEMSHPIVILTAISVDSTI